MKNELIRFYFKNYLYGLIVFTLLRLFLFYLNKQEMTESVHSGIILEAFFIGFRFDTVILCYILLPIWLYHFIFYFIKKQEINFKLSQYFFSGLMALCILIHFMDIPFYQNFKNRLNASVFNWNNHLDFAFGMILKDSTLRLFLIGAILVLILHFYLYKKWIMHYKATHLKPRYFIFLQLVFVCFLFIGMRGRLAFKSPIRTGTAYFCEFPFFNHLGLNPVFTLIKSASENDSKKLKFLDGIIPPNAALNYLDKQALPNFDSALFHLKDSTIKPNVVFILMEGMSANFLKRYGCTSGLSNGLDSLMQHSIVFDNFYSSGTHTFNGVYSSTMSQPCLPETHPMKATTIPTMNNTVKQFKKNNYNTYYFTTHDDQFDNIGGFLISNGFDKIISEKDYNKSDIKSNLGVPDHVMFNYALNAFNNYAKENKPFFSTLLTASNHQPIIVPIDLGITYKNLDDENRIKEYADYSVTQFIQSACKTDWGKNTIFVITGDHGKAIDHDYEISMAYHHIPLIIYSDLFKTKNIYLKNLGAQEDILPSIAGLLGIDSSSSNTIGKNLFKTNRPYIISIEDEKVVVIDTNHLLVFSKNLEDKYYALKYKKAIPLDAKSKEMKMFGAAYLQTARAFRK